MIIKNKTSQTTIYIPKHKVEHKSLFYKLYFVSEYTNKEYLFNVVDEKNFMDYFVFTLNLEDIPEGEYVYKLIPVFSYYDVKKKENIEYTTSCISTGLIIIGKERETKQVKEYLPDNKIKENDKIIYYEAD